jgi:hypothetical protein
MRTPKVNPVVVIPKHRPITRGEKFIYQSDIDPAVIIHSSKTHRSVSEAFRDADYATPIWRCESEWDRTKDYLVWIVIWVFTLFILYTFAVGFEKWVSL